MINNLGSGENGVIKSQKQLLIEAEQKIGMLENERRAGIEHIESLKWLVASARSGVAALATHFKLTPADVKVIYDDYCKRESEKILAENEANKKKFVEDLQAGKKVEFETVDRIDDQPKGE
jgi:hypothetical protein